MPAIPLGHVRCLLADLLIEREMTLAQLAERVDITYANLSKLKNNHAKAIRFTTLAAICETLECDVGDLFTVKPVV